jgi:hypothetical protein
VFASISAIFAVLFSATTLPNGIRLIELPGNGGSAEIAEIIVGYDEAGLTAFQGLPGMRSLIFNGYAAGGDIQFIHEQDRTAVRFTIPQWALPMLADRQLASLLNEVPKINEAAEATDFRAKVEDEVRSALLGAEAEPVEYSTDDAFIAISAPIPGDLRDALAAIPHRGLSKKSQEQDRLPAERTLRFKSDLPTGAVIFASPVPSVYYQQWYVLLLLDRVIHQALSAPLKTTLLPSLHPYYYRMELALAAGQFPEPAEENLLQELQRLQLTRVDPQHLLAARQQALAYLNSKETRDWFASRGIPERLEEGTQWVQSLGADDLRVAARDLLLMNRVIATWAPKPKQTTVEVENLNSRAAASDRPHAATPVLPEPAIQPTAFPPHKDAPQNVAVAQKLPSGVSLAASNINAVFVSGAALTKYDREPDADIMKSFEKYRADRILVLAPANGLDRARELWTSFKGSDSREAGVPKGPVSSGDLPAVYVLKTMLELKVIEAGWWPEVELRIDASEGSALQIHADAGRREQIIEWARNIGKQGPSDKDFAWMREVAIHRFDTVRPDLQALTWERDPQGTIQDIETILPKFVQDVAQVYF